MTDRYSDLLTSGPTSRSGRLDRVLTTLLSQAPEMEAAAVVSFDGLPMASALPLGMDEDRVAAMSAALLSLGERAAQGLGRGDLSQVYVEGESGTVFLVSADDEAVLVAVGSRGAKVGLLLFEVRRAAAAVAAALRADDVAPLSPPHVEPVGEPALEPALEPAMAPVTALEPQPVAEPVMAPVPQLEPEPQPQQPQQTPSAQPQHQSVQPVAQQPVTYQPEPHSVPDSGANGTAPRNGPASWS